MGRFMTPCCCVCGLAAKNFNDPDWQWRDFCPSCGKKVEKMYGKLKQYCIFSLLDPLKFKDAK